MLISQLFEDETQHVTFCFGRMNPPTIGHKQVFDTMKSVGGDYLIFLSKTQNAKKDPLDYDTKVDFVKKILPEYADRVVDEPSLRTPWQVASYLYDLGYRHATFVGGDDRKQMYEQLKQFNGVEDKPHGYYKFDTFDFESAGAREEGASGLAGVSATVARQAAVDGDLKAFVAATGAGEHAEELYAAVRKGMGITEKEPEVTEGKDNRIIQKDPVAKQLRQDPQFKQRVVPDKTKYNRKKDKGKDMQFSDIQHESYYDDVDPEVAKLGRILMDKAVSQKDENLSGIMATVGSELTKFGSNQGARDLKQLEKRVGLPEAMIKKMMEYAAKFEDETKYRVKDPDPSADDMEDDDFKEGMMKPGESASRHGGNVLSALQRIVDDKSAQAVNFQDGKGKVDMFTASAIMKVYDAVNDDNKSKMKDALSTKAGFMKMAKFAMSKVGESVEETALDERSKMDVSDKEMQKIMSLGDKQYQSLMQKYLTTKNKSSLESLKAKIAQSLKANGVDFEKASDMIADVADDAVSKKYSFFYFITNSPLDSSDDNDADEAALVIIDRLEGLADYLYFNHEPVEEDSKFDRNFSKRVGYTVKGGAAADMMKKQADQTKQQNKDLDPGADKKGLGIGVLDTTKARKKAKAKGVRAPGSLRASPNTRNPNRLPESCSDCGKPVFVTLPEEIQAKYESINEAKQKGVDGKVCWKGYKRMGTKKKGGKTVDNCVKMTAKEKNK